MRRPDPDGHTLNIPDELYFRLAQGAADRGLSIESLLTFVSEAMFIPDKATARDQARARVADLLLKRARDRHIVFAHRSRARGRHATASVAALSRSSRLQ